MKEKLFTVQTSPPRCNCTCYKRLNLGQKKFGESFLACVNNDHMINDIKLYG